MKLLALLTATLASWVLVYAAWTHPFAFTVAIIALVVAGKMVGRWLDTYDMNEGVGG